jgi:hypothetical protein
MKTLRQLFVASVFTLALTVSALAGEIHTTVTSSPPPPTPQATKADGEISTGVTGQTETGSGEVSATDSATEIALNLLQSVLALF